MNINVDFSQKVVIKHHDFPRIRSPELGAERQILEPQGDEIAKVTSIGHYRV
jgi:hypothetical protein